MEAVKHAKDNTDFKTIITIFIDLNSAKPLTEDEIEEIKKATEELVGKENVPLVNIITTTEPEEDLTDKIKDEIPSTETIPGIKEVDDTVEDITDTINKLKE